MKTMKVSQFGLVFKPEKNLNELTFNLPSNTEILSVSVENKPDGEHVLWFTFIAPAEAYTHKDSPFDNYPWNEFHFFMVNCNYTDINISTHKYIGNIDIDDSTYAVFYEVGEVIKK